MGEIEVLMFVERTVSDMVVVLVGYGDRFSDFLVACRVFMLPGKHVMLWGVSAPR
jgi:hypothetical protein